MSDIDTPNDQPVQPIADQETPLADLAAASGLVHQIQHICEVLASAFLPFFYVGSNRKRRKKISELKKGMDDKTEGKKD